MSKEELMKEIEAEVAVCVKCGLWKRRNHAVPGDGDVDAEVMFIGEAPGRQEDLRGLPFVGAAGKLLVIVIQRQKRLPPAQGCICVVKLRLFGQGFW